ncbi:protein of unknown function [Nitrospina watsonii]|uniref:Uncharacterized protein n=1 Tax=Nitrospina watsonii TaxID=1323948 RepID=A0ABM9HF18_9BACT|nr:protein of unknown function [Nitrospina watsonii]
MKGEVRFDLGTQRSSDIQSKGNPVNPHRLFLTVIQQISYQLQDIPPETQQTLLTLIIPNG